MRLEDCMPLCAQMDMTRVLASLEAAAASNPGRAEEIGGLLSFVAQLAEDHISIRRAPSIPAVAVGYWRGQKGATHAPQWPPNGEIADWAGCKLMLAGPDGTSRVDVMNETHQPVACRTGVVQAIGCQESTGPPRSVGADGWRGAPQQHKGEGIAVVGQSRVGCTYLIERLRPCMSS